MAKKKKGGSKKLTAKQTSEATAANTTTTVTGDGMWVDPARVRFQHAKIRPVFSGCGRSVEGTLQEIRDGIIQPSDLPPIQVLVGPIEEETGLPWYFSLNNRRLWVLKRCREEGLLEELSPKNSIFVRVRKPKSDQEAARYSVANCALEAKIIPEKPRKTTGSSNDQPQPQKTTVDETKGNDIAKKTAKLSLEEESLNLLSGGLGVEDSDSKSSDDSDDDDDDSESSDDDNGPTNRFSALF